MNSCLTIHHLIIHEIFFTFCHWLEFQGWISDIEIDGPAFVPIIGYVLLMWATSVSKRRLNPISTGLFYLGVALEGGEVHPLP